MLQQVDGVSHVVFKGQSHAISQKQIPVNNFIAASWLSCPNTIAVFSALLFETKNGSLTNVSEPMKQFEMVKASA